jgi:hypothetical protein
MILVFSNLFVTKLENRKSQLIDNQFIAIYTGREDGIRTHDTVTHIQTFQACSFNHSDTSLFGVAKNNKFFQ